MSQLTTVMTTWLTDKIAPLLKSRKRVAFRAELNETPVIIVADANGKDEPSYEVLPDFEGNRFEYQGKPLTLSDCPEGIEDFAAVGMVASPTVVTQPSSPTPPQRPVVEVPDEEGAPAPTPEEVPAPKKRGRGKRMPVDFRKRVLESAMADIRMTPAELPPPEVLFERQLSRPHKLVPISKLAAFNDRGAWTGATTEAGKALARLAEEFGERNILNRSAEVETPRILEVLRDLLRHRRLISEIKVCRLMGDIPPNVVPADVPFDRLVYQVVSGRHRVLALALLYGPEVKIPVEVYEAEYRTASVDCMALNEARMVRKPEQIHLSGLLNSDSEDHILADFRSRNGRGKHVAEWIAYHTITEPNPRFVPVMPKVERKGTEIGTTMPNILNVFSEAITAIVTPDNNPFKELDENSTALINAITQTFNLVFENIKRFSPVLATTAWNAYSSGSIGRLIGQALNRALVKEEEYDADDVAANISRVVVGYIQSVSHHQDDIIRKSYVRTPVVEHVAMLRKFAAQAGIDLPIVGKSFITKK